MMLVLAVNIMLLCVFTFGDGSAREYGAMVDGASTVSGDDAYQDGDAAGDCDCQAGRAGECGICDDEERSPTCGGACSDGDGAHAGAGERYTQHAGSLQGLHAIAIGQSRSRRGGAVR